MLRDEVLALLKAREGKPLSGEEMSRALGVSRAAVWKAMESLRDEGYVIYSAPRRGYALESSPDKLSAGELAGALAGRRVGRALVCLETVDSTNNEVKRRALAGAADGLAVVAEQQTGGRGRRGRGGSRPSAEPAAKKPAEEGRQTQPPRQKQKGEQQRPPRPEKQPKASAAPPPASDGTAALPTGEKKRPHRRRYRGKPKGDRPQGPKPES